MGGLTRSSRSLILALWTTVGATRGRCGVLSEQRAVGAAFFRCSVLSVLRAFAVCLTRAGAVSGLFIGRPQSVCARNDLNLPIFVILYEICNLLFLLFKYVIFSSFFLYLF